jgi:hypothetical protein
MTDTEELVSELLTLGTVCFAHDKWVLKGPLKNLRAHIANCRVCLASKQFSNGELHSISKEIYGVAKTAEKQHPKVALRHPEFFKTLERVSRHVYRESGSFECRIDGEVVGVVFLERYPHVDPHPAMAPAMLGMG